MKTQGWVLSILLLLGLIVASYILILRPWHLRWGATDAEVSMSLPGDAWIQPGAAVSTRAITIHAPAPKVWQWIVQLGVGRGGWYSHDWLENLFATGMVNADAIKPELQNAELGDAWLFTKLFPFAARVTLIEPERVLVFDGWTLYLKPLDANTTRLIVRYPMDPDEFINAPLSYSIFEPAHFLMESGMMLGIKQRAEQN